MREVLRVAGTGPGKSDVIPTIDWGAFDRYPKQQIECRDGTIYESHAKLAVVEGRLTLVTQEACPGCGAQFGHVRAARSGPGWDRW